MKKHEITISFFIPLLLVLFTFTGYVNKYLAYVFSGVPSIIYLVYKLNTGCRLKKDFNFFISFLFLLCMFISYFYAVFPNTVLKTFIATFATFLIGALVYSYGNKNTYEYIFRLLIIFSIIFNSVTVLSIIIPTLYTQLIIPLLPLDIQTEALRFYNGTVSSGLTDQTGTNAWFCVLGISISFSKLMNKRSKEFFIVFVLSFLALLFTAKRAHLGFSFFCILFLFFYSNKRKTMKIFRFVSIVILTVLLFSLLFNDIFNSWMYRFHRNDGSDISSNRFFLWGVAFTEFLKRPLFGFGWGYYSNISETNVHNVYIQVLCELGILGEILFIIMLLSNFVSVMRNLKKTIKIKGVLYNYCVFCVFIQLFIIFYCLTGNCFNDLHILVIYYFTIFLNRYVKDEIFHLNRMELKK